MLSAAQALSRLVKGPLNASALAEPEWLLGMLLAYGLAERVEHDAVAITPQGRIWLERHGLSAAPPPAS